MGKCSSVGSGVCPSHRAPQRELACSSLLTPSLHRVTGQLQAFGGIAVREGNGTHFNLYNQAGCYQHINGSFITFFPSHSSLYVFERKNANPVIVLLGEKIYLRSKLLQAIQHCWACKIIQTVWNGLGWWLPYFHCIRSGWENEDVKVRTIIKNELCKAALIQRTLKPILEHQGFSIILELSWHTNLASL